VKSERPAVVALVLLMAMVGAAAWWLQLRPRLHPDYTPLATLPTTIASWSGAASQLETKVEEMLNADFNLQRTYRRPGEPDVIWFYLGYYGTARGGRPEHLPGECYPSAGWKIEQKRTIVIGPDPRWRANELLVSQRGERRLVHFWYRSSHRTGMLDVLSLSVDHLRGRLGDGRADGALVRLSTPIGADGEAAARARLVAFAGSLDPLLDAHWPRELPAGSR